MSVNPVGNRASIAESSEDYAEWIVAYSRRQVDASDQDEVASEGPHTGM